MENVSKYVSALVLVLGLVILWLRPKSNDELLKLETVISSLLKYEENHVDQASPKIAVGFGACKDLFVTRSHLMAVVGFPDHVDNYLGVGDEQEFVSMLGYFFQAGAAAERFVHDDGYWSKLVEAGVRDPDHRWGLGGNAPVMAARFVREGAVVLLGAKLSPGLSDWIPDGLQVAGGEVAEDDVHLIVEYKRNEAWDSVVSPRANRFIVHHDLNNPLVSSLEDFSAALPSFSPQLLVVGGLQMMDNFPFREGQRLDRILGIKKLMQSVDQNTLIHFEMASFVDESLLSELTEHIIPQSDSIGMNEQELPNLESMLTKGKVVDVADSNPRIAVMLDMMRTVYRKLSVTREGARALTRVHLHTLAYQAVLTTRGSAWVNTGAAAVKASLTAHRHVCSDTRVRPEKSFLIMDDSFSTSQEGGRRIPFDNNRPLTCWDEDDLNINICLAPVLVCSEAVQTAGGGDNISAAGLVVQVPGVQA